MNYGLISKILIIQYKKFEHKYMDFLAKVYNQRQNSNLFIFLSGHPDKSHVNIRTSGHLGNSASKNTSFLNIRKKKFNFSCHF